MLGATHYHEIFEGNFLEASSILAFGHMEVYIDENVETIEKQITYLYK